MGIQGTNNNGSNAYWPKKEIKAKEVKVTVSNTKTKGLADQQPLAGFNASNIFLPGDLHDLIIAGRGYQVAGDTQKLATVDPSVPKLNLMMTEHITDHTGAKIPAAYYADAADILNKGKGSITEVVVNVPLKAVNTKFGYEGGNNYLSFVRENISNFAKESDLTVMVYRDGPNFTCRVLGNPPKEMVQGFMNGLKEHFQAIKEVEVLPGKIFSRAEGIQANINGYSLGGKDIHVTDLRRVNRFYIVQANKGISSDSIGEINTKWAKKLNIISPKVKMPEHRASDIWNKDRDMLFTKVMTELNARGAKANPVLVDNMVREFYYEPDSGLTNMEALKFIAENKIAKGLQGAKDVYMVFLDGKKFGSFTKTYDFFGSQALDIIVQKRIVRIAGDVFAKYGISFSRFGTGSEEFGGIGIVDKATMEKACVEFRTQLAKPLVVNVPARELLETDAGKALLKSKGYNPKTVDPEELIELDIADMPRGEGIKGISADVIYKKVEYKGGDLAKCVEDNLKDMTDKVAYAKKANPGYDGKIYNSDDIRLLDMGTGKQTAAVLYDKYSNEYHIFDKNKIEELKTVKDFSVANIKASKGNIAFIKQVILGDKDAKLLSSSDVDGILTEKFMTSSMKEVTIKTSNFGKMIEIATNDGKLFRVLKPEGYVAGRIKLPSMFKNMDELNAWIAEQKKTGLSDSQILEDAINTMNEQGEKDLVKQVEVLQKAGKIMMPLGVAVTLYAVHMINSAPLEDRAKLFASFAASFGTFAAGAKLGSKMPVGGLYGKAAGALVLGMAFAFVGDYYTKKFIEGIPGLNKALQNKALNEIVSLLDPIGLTLSVIKVQTDINDLKSKNDFVGKNGPEAWNAKVESEVYPLQQQINDISAKLQEPVISYMKDNNILSADKVDGKKLQKYVISLAGKMSELTGKIDTLKADEYHLDRSIFRDEESFQKMLKRIQNESKYGYSLAVEG